jgi:hypothetical protein
MALLGSGAMSLGGATAGRSVNLELGRSSTAQISMGESAVRTLAGVASGAISFSNFYSKSAAVAEILYSFNTTGNAQSFTASNATITVEGAVTGTALEATSFTDVFGTVTENNNFTGSWRWRFSNTLTGLMRASSQPLRTGREVTLVSNIRRRAGTGSLNIDYGDGTTNTLSSSNLPLNTFTVVSIPVIAGAGNFIDFPSNGVYSGWDIDIDYVRADVTGAINFISTASDPILRTPALSISGNTYRYITIRIRRTEGTSWQGDIYYSTGLHSESELYKKTIEEPIWGDGAFQTLIVDMADLTVGGTDWTDSTISQIRFDFGTAAGDNFQIDYIRLSSTP